MLFVSKSVKLTGRAGMFYVVRVYSINQATGELVRDRELSYSDVAGS